MIADRFTNAEDKAWFDKCLSRVVEEDGDLGGWMDLRGWVGT